MVEAGKFIIYGLVDPRTWEIRCVGKSCSGFFRPRTHGATSNMKADTYKNRWLRQLFALGLDYGITVLEELTTHDGLCDAERHWIAKLRLAGARLTNMTDGGDGMVGHVHTCSFETKEKMRAAKIGRRLPAETRTKMSLARKGRHLTKETRQKIGKAHKGRSLTPEHRFKLSLAKRDMVVSEAQLLGLTKGRAKLKSMTYAERIINNFHANKTHCARGHEFDSANTYLYRNSRQCKTCKKLRRAQTSGEG